MVRPIKVCVRREIFAIIVLLAVAVLIFVQHNKDILQLKVDSTIIAQRVTTAERVSTTQRVTDSVTDPDMHRGLCKLKPLSTMEALEERQLLDFIAWPETPVLPDPFLLEESSDPAHSTFTIFPERKGGQWHVGDQLEVMIKISDFKGRPKKSGGDFIIARVHNPKLNAGVAGQVVDHLNGSYSAVFSLLWEGDAQIEVTLVHPSEAISVLTRLNIEQPDRMHFQSIFRSGSLHETTGCNVCLRDLQRPKCNFTDPRTGEPWFCYKPKMLDCDTRCTHGTDSNCPGCFRGFRQDLRKGEDDLFKSDVNMKVSIQAAGPASVTVLPKVKGQPEVKSSIATPRPLGYYHKGVWQALDGTSVHQFDVPATIECLRGKEVHMFGDSTVRMWFEFLSGRLPDLKEFAVYSPGKAGPHMAMDYKNKILVKSRFHGVPIRIDSVAASELRFAENEIDRLIGGPNTIVVIGVWAHFGTFPVEVYIRRLLSIRKAVVRLLNRAPGTKVLIRTGNPKALTIFYALTNSDWYTLQCDKVLRSMFKGLNVRMIYAWEMVVAHHLPHNLHPTTPIIKDMIDVLLSYVCPQKNV